MDDVEAQRQIQQMVNFILNEARDKAQEIEAKSLEDFNIEKLKIVQQLKDKARTDYQRKAKQLETQRAIARSTAINKARLKKIAARQKVIEEATTAAAKQIAKVTTDAGKYRELMIDLIVQAALSLLEDEVFVQCRDEDLSLVKSILDEATKKYSKVIKDLAGVDKSVKIIIDETNKLAASSSSGKVGKTCNGGVIVTTMNRKIVVDNTLDTRLTTVVTDQLPQLRKMLFPV